MNKAVEYANKVLSEEIVAPTQVKQACLNFLEEFYVLQDDSEYKFFWDNDTEELVNEIINNLNFARGPKARQSIGENLGLFQRFFILNIFAWKHKANPDKRKIEEAILTVARKNAKSNIAAIIHIVAMMIDEEDAKHFCAANDKEQAGYVYDEICDILKNSPNALPLFKVMKSYVEYVPKRTKLVALAGTPKDGAQSFVATIDECGRENSIADMVNAIEGGQFGPTSPLRVKISTSYPIRNAYNYWQTVIDGLVENTMNENANPHKFGLAFLIDNPDEEIELNGEVVPRWQDKSTWLESNPMFAEIPSLLDKLYRDYESKKDNVSEFEYFLVKNLNIWRPATNEDEQMFISFNKLERNQDWSIDWEFFKGKMVVIGLDVAMKNDNLSFIFMTYENGKTYVRDIVFYPKGEEANKSKFEGIPYAEFTTKGYSKDFGNETVDTANLGEYVYENYIKKYEMDLGTVLFDQKYAEEIIEYFQEEVGMEVEPIMVTQNSFTLGPVISDFQKEMLDGDVLYYPNPLTTSAYINSIVHYPKGKPYIKKPENGKVKNKIDSMFASLNAFFGIRYFRKRGWFD